MNTHALETYDLNHALTNEMLVIFRYLDGK
jgi:hypothetical protein